MTTLYLYLKIYIGCQYSSESTLNFCFSLLNVSVNIEIFKCHLKSHLFEESYILVVILMYFMLTHCPFFTVFNVFFSNCKVLLNVTESVLYKYFIIINSSILLVDYHYKWYHVSMMLFVFFTIIISVLVSLLMLLLLLVWGLPLEHVLGSLSGCCTLYLFETVFIFDAEVYLI